MKKFNILMITAVFALLATGCVKPAQDTQPIYTDTSTAQGVYNAGQPVVYETAQPIVYETAPSGTVYQDVQADGTVIMPVTQPVTQPAMTDTTYPDPYANGVGTEVYQDPYASQPIDNYPINNYPVSTPAVSQSGSGIHLQIAALKNYSTAVDYKNRLSLAPGLSAYVQQGAMNKVIVTGIPSLAEANRLKESRFPGAFIVQGASTGGYTPPVQPNYDTSSGGVYTINNPYGTTAVSGNSGIGVQIGAFGSQSKAQAVANTQGAQYPAVVRKIGQYYKVILTGFPSRTAAKAHASRVGGFVVSSY
ncbi:MAG: Unknown protein [uncultured Sulfurovum sp.]|uniref:SPOR domain-containing protein n=1 Tax=uncultured Sulfurovum sp. TaxID=269237 RepID=A0A6S6RWU7_9BACT|nr:MAG: Unknown protein [uncultured Sulfurovum sp.]